MKAYVIDASVVVKWIFPDNLEENNSSQAVNLLKTIQQGSCKIFQPPHWLAEAAAVIVRLQPKIAEESIELLSALEFPIIAETEVYQLACELSERYNHHLFDTLYHAVAIYRGNMQFITADEQYYRKAAKQGSILRLADFSVFETA